MCNFLTLLTSDKVRYCYFMAKQKYPTTGEKFPDGSLIELIYDEKADKTKFALKFKDSTSIVDDYNYSNKKYVPYSEQNSLIKNKMVMLPSKPLEYTSQDHLVKDIQNLINKYVDLEPLFEKLCAYYVLLSWVYDGFNQIPYIRKSGDFGTGKTRFLTVVGSLCYKPIFASGSSSTAAIFHTLDKFRGTLILDEADFRYSDEKADLTKVLNNGFTKGYPVLRCAFNKDKEFDPVGYQVYGCKLVASRKHFSDSALESRFITEKPNLKKLRVDIPIELPESFQIKALELRNKLLMYRFNMLEPITKYKIDYSIKGAEPRINQIFSPLLQLIGDEKLKAELEILALEYSKLITNQRSETIEFHVLMAIRKLSAERNKVSVGDIANFIFFEYDGLHERKITPRWIGNILTKSLQIKKYKCGGKFFIEDNQTELLDQLFKRYGVCD